MNYSSEQKEYFEKLIEPDILEKLPLYDTMCELLEMCRTRYSGQPAVSDMKETITYGQLYDRIACRRTFLYEQGFKKGDIIAVLAPNSMYSMELYMAIPTAGCTVIMIPSAEKAVTPEILAGLIERFDIKGLFAAEGYENVVKGQNTRVFNIYDTADTMSPSADVDKNDTAVICFSVSDNPAKPHGAMLSHGGIMRAAHNGLFIPGHTYNQTTVAILPLSHVFGAIRGLLTCIYTGALVYACEDMSNIIFDIPAMKPTILTLVPGLAEMVLAVAKIKGSGFLDGIETMICGGAYCHPKLVKQAESYGIKLLVGYGLTEASGIVSGNVDMDAFPDSIGRVYPGTEVRIENGEIQVRGDVVMKGYYGEPEKTREMFAEDGWLKTGDAGEFDDSGYLHITGLRKNLIILPNGENISPEELQNTFMKAEGIKDCRIKEDSLRGRPLIAIEILPDMVYYEGKEHADIEADLKKKVKQINETLPSYKTVTKTIILSEPPSHEFNGRIYEIQW